MIAGAGSDLSHDLENCAELPAQLGDDVSFGFRGIPGDRLNSAPSLKRRT